MSDLRERLRTTDLDTSVVRSHQASLIRQFKIASVTALRHGIMAERDVAAVAGASQMLNSSPHPRLATSPLFEWATGQLVEAARTATLLAPTFADHLDEAANRASVEDAIVVPAQAALHPYVLILNDVVARQEVHTSHVRSDVSVEPNILSQIWSCVETVLTCLPTALVNLDSFVNTIVPFAHPEISGTSVAGATGLIFVRAEEHPLDTVDHLIHEWGHNKFELILNDYALWHDEAQLLPSPIRDDLRPIYGVCHANFVLLTVSDAMAHIGARNDSLQAIAYQKAAAFLDECEASLLALSDCGNITIDGHEFVDISSDWLLSIRERCA